MVAGSFRGNGTESAGGSSPPLCLDIDTDDIIYIANNDWESANLTRSAVQAVQRNVWQHWRIDALFHSNPATGWVKVWVDAVLEVDRSMATMLIGGGESNYHKTGIYRDPSNTATAILWHDNIVITDPS